MGEVYRAKDTRLDRIVAEWRASTQWDSPLCEPVGWIQHHQRYSSGGADILMESIALKPPQ
jgi:hypothetical protein